MDEKPTAQVKEIDGQLVLDDPVALGMARAVEKHNCKLTLAENVERIGHFRKRVVELGRTPKEVVIVVINVDDAFGGCVAELLMPGHDWQAYRDRGEVPFARGIADRGGLEDILGPYDPEAAKKLREWDDPTTAVVVIDRHVAEIF